MKFDTLNQLYEHLEKDGYKQWGEYITSTLFRSFLKNRDADTSDDTRFARWEYAFFSFPIFENKLGYHIASSDKDGNVSGFPDIKLFSDEQFQYLIKRQAEANNAMLKARYSHILWLSPKPHKHTKYAEDAINAYLALTDELSKGVDKKREFEILTLLKNAFLISTSSKKLEQEVKSKILLLINGPANGSHLRYALIQFALEYPDSFFVADLKTFEPIVETISLETIQASEHSFVETLSDIGLRLVKKTGSVEEPWIKRKAEALEAMIEQRKDAGIVTVDYCLTAIDLYKKLGDKDKVSALEKRYYELQKEIKLGTVGKEFDITEMVRQYRVMADSLSDESAEIILNVLMRDTTIIPTYDEIKKITGKVMQESPMWLLVSPKLIDENSHTSEHFNTDEDKEYFNMLTQYSMLLKFSKTHLIREIILTAVMNQKLTLQSVVAFLQTNAWFGKDLEKRGVDIEQYNWLGVIIPSLNEFFVQIQGAFLFPGYTPNFVLCIDSLSTKIEGLLRDLCRFRGGITFFITKVDGKEIAREKDITALLYDEKIVELIGKDDLLFLKFLLVEHAGFNLRHRVAHSMLFYQNYGIDLMNLLFVALLKLAKYNFTEREPEPAS